MRRFAAAPALLAILVLLATGCPSRGGSTPEETFALGQTYIREGRYEKVWSLFSESYQRKVSEGFREHQRILREATENRPMYEREIRKQYDLDPETFLATSPRELAARVLRLQREESLALTIEGEAEIEGDRAVLMVRGGGGMPAYPMILRRVEGRWLIDDVPTSPRPFGPQSPR